MMPWTGIKKVRNLTHLLLKVDLLMITSDMGPSSLLDNHTIPTSTPTQTGRPISGNNGLITSDMGPSSLLDDHTIQLSSTPAQTDARFQELIAAANELGIIYTSRKGKEKEEQLTPPVAANGGDAIATSSERKEAGTNETGELPSCGHHEIEDGEFNKLSVLMVSTQCPSGMNSHTMFTVMTREVEMSGDSAYVIDLYGALRSSQQQECLAVNSDINAMNSSEIQLGTAGVPVFMDDVDNFGRSWTGFRPLGLLEELDVKTLIKPVRNSEDNWKFSIMDLYNQNPNLDLYILYVWEGVSV